jgi:hypothetical protein
MNRGRLLWVLALLFLSDLAMPLSPGAWQPLEPGQSVEAARRLTVQAASAQLPPLPHRFPSIAQPAPRIEANASSETHFEITLRTFAPLARSPQHEVAALSAVDPA